MEYAVKSRLFLSSPWWGMDATAVASPDAAMYRDIQRLKSEVRVSCDGVARVYLDGMFGMHMLQAAERASSREKNPSTDSDSEEESFPIYFRQRLPQYLKDRTFWAEAPFSQSEKLPKLYQHLHFSKKLLNSACRRLRESDSENASFEYKLLYLWHGSFVVQAFDCDSVNKDGHPQPTPLSTATLFFLGDTYEHQMILLRPLFHSVLCEGLQAAEKRALRPRVRLSLKINYVLCSAPMYPVLGVPMVLRLQAALREKINKNWIGMPFISSIHVSKILNHNTIVHCLAHDQKFFDGSEDDPKEASHRLVTRWLSMAPGMLTMCLLKDQDFSSLEFLVREGITDSNFAISLVKEKHAAGVYDRALSLDALLSLKPSYDARHLIAERAIFVVRKDEVIPMFCYGPGPISRLDGRSEVYMVHFEPGYQDFTENPLDTFMLKRFRISRRISTNASYEGFSDLSHPHLITHLGGWICEDELFLIFPTPVLTLYELLNSRRSVYSTEEGIDSILRQLAGIADAIKYLSQLQDSRKGFHHGIRPDNIYLFPSEHKKDLYTWRLGSFGTDFEMYKFSEQTKTIIEASWARRYAAPESRYDPENTQKELDVWSLGCVFVVVLNWLLEQVDQKILRYPFEMWTAGQPFWQENPQGNIVLRPSVTQFLKTTRASKSLPVSMKRIAYLASTCLVVDQKERRLLNLAGMGIKYRAEIARSVVSQAAEPEGELEDNTLSSSLSSATSQPLKSQPSASLFTKMRTDDLNFSSYPQADGWAMAELGLGVEPYIAKGYHRPQTVNAAFKADQRPLVESMLRPKNLMLPDRTLATGGASSLASGQSLDHHVGKLGGDLVQKKRTEKLDTEDAVEQNARAEKGAAFVRGLIYWEDLSSEEQKACMGPKFGRSQSKGIYYEPKGLLKEFWETYLYPGFRRFSEEDQDLSLRVLLRHYDRSTLEIRLIVLQRETSQQLRPTILIKSTSDEVSNEVSWSFWRYLKQNEALPALALSFDCLTLSTESASYE